MRVLIIHNPAAGHPTRRGDAIVRAFKDAGHTVWYRSTGGNAWIRALDDAIDVVVVVGGDGTVATVVRQLATRSPRQSKPPVTILPFGTANNVARSLGIRADPARLAAGLVRAVPSTFRVIRVSAPWGERLAVESAGIGIFPQLFRDARERELRAVRERKPAPRSWSVRQAREQLVRVVRDAQPRAVRVLADGEDLSGEYLLVEALNIGRIGPRARLSRTADVGDLRLDLLLVTAKQRSELIDYFATSEDDGADSSLKTLRVRTARIGWPADGGHVDDALWPRRKPARTSGRPAAVSMRIDHWLTVWTLPPAAGSPA